VVDTKFLRRLNLSCLPFLPVDVPKIMPDGTVTVAAIIDWREFEKNNTNKNPQLLQWFKKFDDSNSIKCSVSNNVSQIKKTCFGNNTIQWFGQF
jgi:hypothetical protein